jgi:hypothetical protein
MRTLQANALLKEAQHFRDNDREYNKSSAGPWQRRSSKVSNPLRFQALIEDMPSRWHLSSTLKSATSGRVWMASKTGRGTDIASLLPHPIKALMHALLD